MMILIFHIIIIILLLSMIAFTDLNWIGKKWGLFLSLEGTLIGSVLFGKVISVDGSGGGSGGGKNQKNKHTNKHQKKKTKAKATTTTTTTTTITTNIKKSLKEKKYEAQYSVIGLINHYNLFARLRQCDIDALKLVISYL